VRRTAVLLSGGLDSSTLLGSRIDSVSRAIVIRYGQRHAREIKAAHEVAMFYGVPLVEVDLSSFGAALPGNALTGATSVPHGHYAHESMKATVVPYRNLAFLAVAAGIAAAHGDAEVAIATHAGDHPIYSDCRPDFIAAARHALGVGHEPHVNLSAPFLMLDKAAIVRVGRDAGVPFELTWSCYEGGALHCGRCGTCVERREAFAIARVTDPTEYAS
jgi:7-cyano-7-deazaguanine synthase